MKIKLQQIRQAQQTQRPLPADHPPGKTAQRPEKFQDLLKAQMGEGQENVKFSAHAQQRIQQRDIHFGRQDFAQLSGAIRQAAAKGAKESLVLMGDKALVVSIPNRTVITAVGNEQMKDNVFTNIDSTVLV